MPTTKQFQNFYNDKPDYPNPNISRILPLKTMIEHYPNEELIPKLLQLQKRYKYYRAVQGDGNCFYRAVLFQYLRDADLANYSELFPPVDLFQCKGLPFNKQPGFTSDNLLYWTWGQILLPLNQFSKEQREKQLERIFNNSKNLDAVLIAYLRARNHQYLERHRSDYEHFSDGRIDYDLERILNFGEQSEGVQLFTLAQLLKAQITILVVTTEDYAQIKFNEAAHNRLNIIVSYRPGHYDIPVDKDPSQQAKEQQHISKISWYERVSLPSFQRTPKPQPKDRKTFPQIISVQHPNEIKLIPIKSSERKWFTSNSSKNLPRNIKDFRASKNLVQQINEEEKEEQESKTQNKKSLLNKSRLEFYPSKTKLKGTKPPQKLSNKYLEVGFCLLCIFIILSSIFLI